MVYTDQQYVDALVHHDPAVLEKIYQQYSGKVSRLVKEAGNAGRQTEGPEGEGGRENPAWAADVFRKALVSLRNKAKSSTLPMTPSFEQLFLEECMHFIHRRSARAEPGTGAGKKVAADAASSDEQLQNERIRLIEEALSGLAASCQKVLRIYWSGTSLAELAGGGPGKITLNEKEGRKLKSRCMQQLIALLPAAFSTKK